MKLKRNDLVSDFELIVKQEIKNHNDAVLAGNLAINKLNGKVLELSQSLDRQINKLDNRTINLTYEFEAILNSYKLIRRDFIKLSSDNSRSNDRNFKEIQIIDQSVETVHRNQCNVQLSFNKLTDSVSKIAKEIEDLKKARQVEVERMRFNFERSLKRLKEEILSMPTDSYQIKEELEEQIAMHKIDNEGLLKEIEVIKKSAFIGEKKIENLYTLIERLKITKDGLI